MSNPIVKRLKSSTYWLNVLSAVIVAAIEILPGAAESLGSFYLPGFMLLTAANLIVRETLTNGPISEK